MPDTTKDTVIAVVDDHSGFRRAIQRLLATSGFIVQTFALGGDFLRTVGFTQPDCLVLDLHMPEVSGIDVLRHLGELQAKFPTIVVSGDNHPGIPETIARAGAAAFLLNRWRPTTYCRPSPVPAWFA